MSGNWQLTRGTLDAIESDAEGQQRIVARGLKGERFTGIYRAQTFGFTSTPPAGSDLMMLRLGSSERVLAIGVENPAKRPTAKPADFVSIYGANGEIVSLVERKMRVKTAEKQVFKVGDAFFRLKGDRLECSVPIYCPNVITATPPPEGDDEV